MRSSTWIPVCFSNADHERLGELRVLAVVEDDRRPRLAAAAGEQQRAGTGGERAQAPQVPGSPNARRRAVRWASHVAGRGSVEDARARCAG